MEDIPSSLIINWDQTAVQVVPSCSWTMEKKGTKRIEVAGIDQTSDNCCIWMYFVWKFFAHPAHM